MKNIIVTGLGVVSNIGKDLNSFWNNLILNKVGISKVKSLDLSEFPFPCKNGGEINDFNPESYSSSNEFLELGKSSQMAIVATNECLRHAGLIDYRKSHRIAVIFGTTIGEALEIEKLDNVWIKNLAGEVPIRTCSNVFHDNISKNVAKEFELYGPNYLMSNACSASNFAINQGVQLIQAGMVDAVVVGGSDAFCRFTYTGFARLNNVSLDFPKPFSIDRDGMIPAEGAGVLLLEDSEFARKRNARALAEIAGIGMSCDADKITAVSQEGLELAYKNALENANLNPEQIGYISPHGTGTVNNDLMEIRAFKNVFKEHIYKIPLSSIKSSIGHAMGASSALEAIASVMVLQDQKLPPTVNFTKLDTEAEGFDIVPMKSRTASVNYVFETASGFGGNNCAVIFKRSKEGNDDV